MPKGIGMNIIEESKNLAAELVEVDVDSMEVISEEPEPGQVKEPECSDSELEYRSAVKKDFGQNKLMINNERKTINKMINKLNFFLTDIQGMPDDSKARKRLEKIMCDLIKQCEDEKSQIKFPR